MRRGARVRIVTDHAKYFEQIEKVLRSSSLRVVDFDAPAAAADSEEIVGTNFERKYRREGRAFHAMACERV
jgi:tRNA G46 methylase TrmB